MAPAAPPIRPVPRPHPPTPPTCALHVARHLLCARRNCPPPTRTLRREDDRRRTLSHILRKCFRVLPGRTGSSDLGPDRKRTGRKPGPWREKRARYGGRRRGRRAWGAGRGLQAAGEAADRARRRARRPARGLTLRACEGIVWRCTSGSESYPVATKARGAGLHRVPLRCIAAAAVAGEPARADPPPARTRRAPWRRCPQRPCPGCPQLRAGGLARRRPRPNGGRRRGSDVASRAVGHGGAPCMHGLPRACLGALPGCAWRFLGWMGSFAPFCSTRLPANKGVD